MFHRSFWKGFVRWAMDRDMTLAMLGVPRAQRRQVETTYPGGIEDIANLLVPELQHQGLYRKEYEGDTFRDNLGLVRPPHPSAKQVSRMGWAAG